MIRVSTGYAQVRNNFLNVKSRFTPRRYNEEIHYI